MKIVKYKKETSGGYQVYFDDNSHFLLYEEVILHNDLLITKEVDDINVLLRENSQYEAYYDSLKYLKHHLRSIHEMHNYLQKKGYDELLITHVINKLENEHYLNDEMYAEVYIHDRLLLSNDGPLKIIKYLEGENIPSHIVSKKIMVFNQDIINERLSKYINHAIKSNRKSILAFKGKMLYTLTNLGYDYNDINFHLNSLNNYDDTNNYQIQYDKVRKRLERKYQGIELERTVKNKLRQMGYFE